VSEDVGERDTRLFAAYELVGDGTSFSIHDGQQYFNRGVKRGTTILVTGDRPRFALMRTLPDDKLDPDLIKLGDGRVRIGEGDNAVWLDECRAVSTVFHPHGTEYTVSSPDFPDLSISLVVAQAGDWGLVARLSLANESARPVETRVDVCYGGLARCGRTMDAAYFPLDGVDTSRNTVIGADDHVTLADRDLPDHVVVVSVPRQQPAVSGPYVSFAHSVGLAPGETCRVYLIAGHSGATNEIERMVLDGDPEHLIAEGKEHYERLLRPFRISTPSAVLDAGFLTAVLNLEYDYAAPAWLEGVHWWSAYWANNYQISAALSLGQTARAREALAFFGSGEGGPCPLRLASGTPITDPAYGGADSRDYGTEDGLPYYILQLLRYYEHTGDLTLLEGVWDGLRRALDRLWEVRDRDGDLLLDWHLHCNAFLYQADHLGMPGAAASPSLMMAGLLERLADVAGQRGHAEDGARWASRADRMYERLRERLWNREQGVFYNHVDLQSLAHLAHYYTDLVFPTLYTSLPEDYGWQSLAHLRRTLCLAGPGGLLMRVGDFKPSIFGNDNVMPTQMAEAARAFFLEGDTATGAALLEAVALAGTVFTDAPGNFPERMGDDGKGIANYIFGNPIGSFIEGVIAGLFGLSLVDGGTTLRWQPGFPGGWDRAALTLPDADVSFERLTLDATTTRLVYTVGGARPRQLHFSVFVKPGRVTRVRDDDKDVAYSITPALGTLRLAMSLERAATHRIAIDYTPVDVELTGPSQCGRDMPLHWTLSSAVAGVRDPQGALRDIDVDGGTIRAVAAGGVGAHQVFVELSDIPVIYPISLDIRPRYRVSWGDALYDADTQSIYLHVRVEAEGSIASGARMRVALAGAAAIMNLDGLADGLLAIDIVLPNVALLPTGAYTIDGALLVGDDEIHRETGTITVYGKDAATQLVMRRRRDTLSRQIDLRAFYNTSTVWATSRWRDEESPIDLAALTGPDGVLETDAGPFRLPIDDGPSLVLVAYGYSDAYTRETIRGDKPSAVEIPVGHRASMLSLLYLTEVESRHTGATVGCIRLRYDQGADARVPLVVGENVDSLYDHFARATTPIKLRAVGLPGDFDYVNLLTLPCDSARVLQSFTIDLAVPDVQCGLIGATAIRHN